MTDRFSKSVLFRTLEYKPHALQAEVHRSTAPRRVLAWGVRGGKTRCAAMEAIAGALVPSDALHPRRGWVVAPDYTLAEKVFREVQLIARERLPELIREDKEYKLVLANMGGGFCELSAKTAENPTALLGEGLDFLVIDEAARLRPDIWDRYLSARLIDKKGWALLISTPRGKGWFYNAWLRKGDGWQSWQAPSWSNPHLDKAEIDAVRARIPEAVFRQEYGAEFIEGAGAVFRNVRDLATGEWAEPIEGETYSAGIDFAKTIDYTVIVILDSARRVVFMDRFNRVDWNVQLPRLKAATDRYNNAFAVVDSTSMGGEFITEKLLEAGMRAEGYAFTQQSKAAAVNNLAMMLENRLITLPRPELAPELIDELEAFQYTVTDAGNVKTEAPSGMHDDCVSAAMLAAWGARDTGNFEVQWV